MNAASEPEKETVMSNQPKFHAYAVKDRGTGKKSYFTRIGAAWPTKNGEGLNIMLEALPLGGTITLLPPKANDKAADTFEGEVR